MLSHFISQHFENLIPLEMIAFQSLGALLTGFLLCILMMPFFIKTASLWQHTGQPIRQDGPATHFVKKGTPTMGGLVVLTSLILSVLLWADLSSEYIQILITSTVCYAALGFIDDFLKVKHKNIKGVTGHQKLFFQFLTATVLICWSMSLVSPEYATSVPLPFWKTFFINLGIFFVAFEAIVIVGTSNAVNLTDGLDGLVSIPLVICFFVFSVFACIIGNVGFAEEFKLIYLSGASEICVFSFAVIGSLIGFLVFNIHPAKIFMGDVGSLSLGGTLGTLAVLLKSELILAIVGGLFVVEALSDMLQVASYKLRKKRIFLMAPIHHHFEKKGWSEIKVVVCFWFVSLFLAAVALLTLGIK